jgi:hypothetical protein
MDNGLINKLAKPITQAGMFHVLIVAVIQCHSPDVTADRLTDRMDQNNNGPSLLQPLQILLCAKALNTTHINAVHNL